MDSRRPAHLPQPSSALGARARRFPDSWLFGALWMLAMLLVAAGAVRADVSRAPAVLKAVAAPFQAAARAPSR